MKIFYLNTESLYGAINSGSLRCSASNLSMVKSASNGEYMHVYLGDKEAKISDRVYEFPREERKMQKLLLSMNGRRFINGKTEKKIAQLILGYAPDILLYEGPYWDNVVRYVKKANPNICFINFMQNVEKEYYGNLRDRSFSMKILYKVTCKCEIRSLECADRIICLNKRDGDSLKRIYDRTCDLLLPINMGDNFDSSRQQSYERNNTLLFVGSLFPPNYDGILWFIDNIMSKMTDYKLLIVGRGFETVKDNLERDNVKVIGSVEDLSEYYYKYPAMVMPIQYGAGMKVKTAEALMYGKVLFATDEALEGYNAEGVNGVFRCNTAEEFIDRINVEYNNSVDGIYQDSVRRFFKENYDTTTLQNSFTDKMNMWIK